MNYTIDDVEKIVNYKSWADRKKIDALLKIDVHMYANLGIESTKTEIELVKKRSRKIYRAIKLINKELGGSFLRAYY